MFLPSWLVGFDLYKWHCIFLLGHLLQGLGDFDHRGLQEYDPIATFHLLLNKFAEENIMWNTTENETCLKSTDGHFGRSTVVLEGKSIFRVYLQEQVSACWGGWVSRVLEVAQRNQLEV